VIFVNQGATMKRDFSVMKAVVATAALAFGASSSAAGDRDRRILRRPVLGNCYNGDPPPIR